MRWMLLTDEETNYRTLVGLPDELPMNVIEKARNDANLAHIGIASGEFVTDARASELEREGVERVPLPLILFTI
jgi:hypothetical protein